MEASDYKDLIPIIVLGAFFFVTAVGALYWAAKRGQMKNLNEQARTIFTEEEPEGEISDSFPDKKRKK